MTLDVFGRNPELTFTCVHFHFTTKTQECMVWNILDKDLKTRCVLGAKQMCIAFWFLNGTTSNIIIHRWGYQRPGRIIIVIKTITNHPPTQQWHSGMHNNSRKHTHTQDKTTGTSKNVCLLSTHLNCKRSEIKLWIPAPPTKRGGFEFPTPPTRRDGFEFPEPTYLFKILSRAWLRGSKIAPFNIEAWKIRVITVQSSLMITIRVATCMRTSTL